MSRTDPYAAAGILGMALLAALDICGLLPMLLWTGSVIVVVIVAAAIRDPRT